MSTLLTCLSIIFVHGLGGHPRRTWDDNQRAKNTDGRTGTPTRRTNLESLFSRKHADSTVFDNDDKNDREASDTAYVFWPQDYLVPDLPEARAWTYGYNADVIGTFAVNNQNSVSQHGRDLAVKLERELEDQVCLFSGLGRMILILTAIIGSDYICGPRSWGHHRERCVFNSRPTIT
jgi:hypothetical protein